MTLSVIGLGSIGKVIRTTRHGRRFGAGAPSRSGRAEADGCRW
jgi:hypothetical protein